MVKPTLYYDAFVEEMPSLEGKCVAITGTTSGTGFWTAMAAVKKGASALILMNRTSKRAAEADAHITATAEGKATTVHSGFISARAAGDSWIPPGRSITPPDLDQTLA